MNEGLLQEYSRVLQRVSRSPAQRTGETSLVFAEILEACSRTLKVPRMALWILDDGAKKLHCAGVFTAEEGLGSTDEVIVYDSYPAYFEALKESRTIAAGDVHADPRTREFTELYCAQHDIGAMLDTPIMVDGRLAGVLCAEHTGGTREWTEEEATFSASMGDLAALAISTSQLRRAEAKVRQREEELDMALGAARMGTWRVDVSPLRLTASPQIADIYGMTEALIPTDLEKYLQIVHVEDHEAVRRDQAAILAGTSRKINRHRCTRPDGEIVWVEVHVTVVLDEQGEPLTWIGSTVDVTEAQELASQLARSQRLEALGRLAGGIAHDFNNLLSATLTSVDLMLLRKPDEEEQDLLNTMVSSIERASGLTRQLLQFARREPGHPETLDLSAACRDLQKLLTRLLPDGVLLTLDTATEPMLVDLDPSHVEQLVINLVVNAREALGDRGQIALTVARLAGDRIELCVHDDGPGIEPSAIARVFDPFFTTREDGSGLGLATCYGIVEQAGGTITAGDSPHGGACFRIELPRSQATALPAPTQAPARPSPDRTTGRVLLVEDEAPLRELLELVLKRRGYEVLLAESAGAAIECAAQQPDLTALITDVSLPGGSGPSIAAAINRPDLPVLFISGYSEEPVSLRNRQAFLHKPFRIEDLYRELDRLLAEGA